MSNKFPIKENVYLVLLQYFDGEIKNINKKTLKDLSNQKFEGNEIDEVDKKAMTVLKKIIKMKKDDPSKYASIEWIYPDWDEEEKKQFSPEIIETPSEVDGLNDMSIGNFK